MPLKAGASVTELRSPLHGYLHAAASEIAMKRSILAALALLMASSTAFAQTDDDHKNAEGRAAERQEAPPPVQPSYDRPLNNTVTAPPGIGNPGSVPRNAGSIPSR